MTVLSGQYFLEGEFGEILILIRGCPDVDIPAIRNLPSVKHTIPARSEP